MQHSIRRNHHLLLSAFIIGICLAAVPPQDSQRDVWQQPERIMDTLKITPGMVIGEGGAGEGYFTFHLSTRVGETGRIYANDIDKTSLAKIIARAKRENRSNIITIVGKVDDPLFPLGALDMVVIMNAFHDFDEPVAWMKNVVSSMKLGALLVLIERDPDKMGSGWHHFMTKETVLARMNETSFRLVTIYTFLQRDNIYVFTLPSDRP
jgi:ubiquinone/menaquinone biosynthesis C-methylase UbiE